MLARRGARPAIAASDARTSPAGAGTVTGTSSRSSTVREWCESPWWRGARVAAGHARAQHDLAAERRRGVGAVERRQPAVPERRRRAEDPRARARRPPRPSRARAGRGASAPAVVIASPSPPYAAPAVRNSASSPRSRSSRTTRECPPGQRAARRLHEPQRARRAAPAPSAQASGASWPCSERTATGARQRRAELRRLDRQHRVLQRAVVELHHVRAGDALRRRARA